MTIQENIDRIFAAKADIKAAIERKGVTVGDALISEYASKIDQIETGGGYDEGFAAGYESGYTKGDEDGFAAGYESGYTIGDTDGYNRGYGDGYASGRADGYDEGYQSGYTTGISDAKGDMISTSITENGTYTREEGFNSVEVNVQGGEVTMTHFAINLTPANIDSTVSVSANGETHTYHNETGRIEFDLYGGLEYTISFGSVSGYYPPMDITGISMYAASNEYSATYERSVSSDSIAIYYNVTSTTMACEIIPNPIEGEYISIDGGDWIPAIRDYTFDTEGEHIVLYKNTNIGYENIIRDSLFKRYSSYERQWMYKIIIPDTITEIGDYAFDESYSLVSITIGNSVTSIGGRAFRYCTSLTSITIPDSVTSIGNYVFSDCSGLISITIPDSVTSIGEGVFYYCTSLTSVTIPDSVTSIDGWIFNNCSSLTNVTIGNSVPTIGNGVFYYCTSLTSVTIPDSVTSIGDWAFYYCYGLRSVTIGNSVTSIDDGAFTNTTSLQSIICKAPTAPSLDYNSFSGIRNSGVLYVPEGSDYSSWLNRLPSGWVIQYM